jgi:hypothetical protein
VLPFLFPTLRSRNMRITGWTLFADLIIVGDANIAGLGAGYFDLSPIFSVDNALGP